MLNPLLYAKLERFSGSEPSIANEGERPIYKCVPDRANKRRYSLQFTFAGEQYRTNCPFCCESRKRLYVSCLWGLKPEMPNWMLQRGYRPYPMLHLWNCFNEGCHERPEYRDVFRGALRHWALANARLRRGKRFVPADQRTVKLPAGCTPVQDLPDSHPANVYLLSRGLDPQHLGSTYGVVYCELPQGTLDWSGANERIVFPIHRGTKLIGWQARAVGELDWKGKDSHVPKYYSASGWQKSKCLGYLDLARQHETLVLVEGVFDAFQVGTAACVSFGKGVSERQLELLADAAGKDRTVVMLLDPDAKEGDGPSYECQALRKKLGAHRVCDVWLPDGTDPGSLETGFLQQFIRESAAAQGVVVSFELRETPASGIVN